MIKNPEHLREEMKGSRVVNWLIELRIPGHLLEEMKGFREVEVRSLGDARSLGIVLQVA